MDKMATDTMCVDISILTASAHLISHLSVVSSDNTDKPQVTADQKGDGRL